MPSLSKLVWLAIAAFAIGTESYVVAGLLPDLAADLHVSVALAGQLITVFALAYAVGSPILAVLTANFERRQVLLSSMAAFAVFNVVAASASSYFALMLARVGLALAAGTFMPAASAYAVAISSAERRGRALAIVYTGLTVSMVIGVPLGVLIGEHLGWRFTFLGVAGLATVALIGMAFALKRLPVTRGATLGERIAVARRPDIFGALVITVVVLAGAFSVYSYLAPYLTQIAGLTHNAIAAGLFVFGVGSAIGNLVSGAATDRVGPQKVIYVVLASLVVLFVVLGLAGTLLSPAVARWVVIPTIAIWGFVGWSFPSAQQARIVAMDPRQAPLTLSLNASAIYLGVSLGAFLGSLMVARGAIGSIGLGAAVCEAAAFGLLVVTARRKRRRKHPLTAVASAGPEDTAVAQPIPPN